MIRALVLWVVGSLLAACVVTPALFEALEATLGEQRWPYSRVFNRVAMLAALVGLWLARRRLETRSLVETWRSESWGPRATRIALGLVLALGPALLVLPLVVAGGEVRWSPDPALALAGRVGKAVPGAVAASFVEEAFFRGIVFLGLARAVGALPAALGSSLLYGWLHFLTPRRDFVYPGWSPGVGFEYLGQVLERQADPSLLAALVGLVLVGLALCRALWRSGSLGLCIGLHAGWFVAAKSGVHLLQLVPGGGASQAAGKRLFLLGQPWTWCAILASVVCIEGVVRAGLHGRGRAAAAEGDPGP